MEDVASGQLRLGRGKFSHAHHSCPITALPTVVVTIVS